MSLLLVAYGFNNAEHDHSGFLKQMEKYSNVRLAESAYAIITDKPPKTVRGELAQFIDKNDNLYVITLKRPYDGCGPGLANDWLKKELTY